MLSFRFASLLVALSVPGASAYRCAGHSMTAGTGTRNLKPGEFLCAGEYRFGLNEDDGSVRLFRLSLAVVVDDGAWDTVWQAGNDGIELKVQVDGNVVLYGPGGKAKWASNTDRTGGTVLVLYNSGEVRLTDSEDTPIWNLGGYDPEWDCISDTLLPDGELHENQFLCIGNSTYGFNDGALSLQFFNLRYGATWSFNTNSRRGGSTQVTDKYSNYAKLQRDGNLVTISPEGRPTWSSRTDGNPGAALELNRLKVGPDEYVSFGDLEFNCRGNYLYPGERLYAGEVLCGDNRYVGIDSTGDFAFWDKYIRNEKIWSANTGPRNPETGGYDTFVKMNGDGYLVVIANSDREIWRSKERGTALSLGIWQPTRVTPMIEQPTGPIELFDETSELPPVRCIPKPVSAPQRFERNEMICDGLSSFGLDVDGRMTSTINLYYIDGVWRGSFRDLSGEFGDHAYFQNDGNYVVYNQLGQAIWSTRNEVVRSESGANSAPPTFNLECFSRAICEYQYVPEVRSTSGCHGSVLKAGERLYSEQFICAGHVHFGVDSKGILGIWIRGRKRKTIAPSQASQWAYSNRLQMQRDGNLVMYSSTDTPLWSTGTHPFSDAYVQIDETGGIGVFTSNGKLLKAIG